MAVIERGKRFHLKFAPFGGKEVTVVTNARTKKEARAVESRIRLACRTSDYRWLDPPTREVCVRLFRNQSWQTPLDLVPEQLKKKDDLTLWQAVEMFGRYPGIKDSKEQWRYEISLSHVVDFFGKDKPLNGIWVPDLKRYQVERRAKGAAPATVNRELSSLSRLFGVMIELQMVEANPMRLVKRLSTKSSEREVYIALQDVQTIANRCPGWYQDLIWMAFYTGMRRGEITNLQRHQVNLTKRVVTLRPTDTKEGAWKRIPLRTELTPLLENAMKVQALGTDLVFLVKDDDGVRPAGKDTAKNPWCRALIGLGWPKPRPVYRDLRATWRTNARRSGMRIDLEKEIMGHETRGKSVHEPYGRISDQELVEAVDRMTFDHGETEVYVAGS